MGMNDSSHRNDSMPVVGDLLMFCYLLAITGGQIYLFNHVASPWREWLLLVSVVVECVGLGCFSDWINRAINNTDLDDEKFSPLESPVVLASSETPGEEAIDQALHLAIRMHKPILLLNLVGAQDSDTSGWIASVRARLSEAGLSVSVQEVYTQDPASTVGEIALAAESSNMIWEGK